MELMKYNTSLIIIYQNSQQKIGAAKLDPHQYQYQRESHASISTIPTKHQKNKRTKPKVIKITRSKNPSNLPPCPPSPLISSFVRISMRLEGNRNYAWRLFIKLIAPSSLILPSPRPPFPFSISN